MSWRLLDREDAISINVDVSRLDLGTLATRNTDAIMPTRLSVHWIRSGIEHVDLALVSASVVGPIFKTNAFGGLTITSPIDQRHPEDPPWRRDLVVDERLIALIKEIEGDVVSKPPPRRWRGTRVPGHTLRFEGAPYVQGPDGTWSPAVRTWQGVGMCSCGDHSEVLDSNERRKRWHRGHKSDIARSQS